MKSLSHVWLFTTPWTAAYQAPPSINFPGKSIGVGYHCLLHNTAIYLLKYFKKQNKNPDITEYWQRYEYTEHLKFSYILMEMLPVDNIATMENSFL